MSSKTDSIPLQFSSIWSFFCDLVISLPTWPNECLFHSVSDVQHSSRQWRNGEFVPMFLPLFHASLTTSEHRLSLSHIDSKRNNFALFLVGFSFLRTSMLWSDTEFATWKSLVVGNNVAQLVDTNALSKHLQTYPFAPSRRLQLKSNLM